MCGNNNKIIITIKYLQLFMNYMGVCLCFSFALIGALGR